MVHIHIPVDIIIPDSQKKWYILFVRSSFHFILKLGKQPSSIINNIINTDIIVIA